MECKDFQRDKCTRRELIHLASQKLTYIESYSLPFDCLTLYNFRRHVINALLRLSREVVVSFVGGHLSQVYLISSALSRGYFG